MNILFLIGNGFDLNVGLNTRYKDVLKFYLQEPKQKNDSCIVQFKKDINHDFENWADFEKQLGIYTGKYTTDKTEDFRTCVKDFKTFLIEHLKNEEKRINYDLHKKEIITVCDNVFTNFYEHLNMSSRNFLKQKLIIASQHLPISYNFITFNYTNVFDNCINIVRKLQKTTESLNLKYKVKRILHIHGSISHNPLIGVDNARQITNTELANMPKITNIIIKPTINQNLKNLNDTAATELIQNSDIICLFGLSLGETDKTWWQQIGTRLQLNSAAQLVIFNIVNKWNPIHPDEEIESIENVRNKFCEVADIDDDIKKQLESRIHIGLNTDLFKMNLVSNT